MEWMMDMGRGVKKPQQLKYWEMEKSVTDLSIHTIVTNCLQHVGEMNPCQGSQSWLSNHVSEGPCAWEDMIREWKWAPESMNCPLKLLLLVPAGSWWLQPVALGCSEFCRRLESGYTWLHFGYWGFRQIQRSNSWALLRNVNQYCLEAVDQRVGCARVLLDFYGVRRLCLSALL